MRKGTNGSPTSSLAVRRRATYDFLYQNIENVRRTAGKTVTLSFWRGAAPAGLQLGVTLFQSFGSGGSPWVLARLPAVLLTLSSVWIRYAVTFAVPSAAGKTFGTTAGTDYLRAGMVALVGIDIQRGSRRDRCAGGNGELLGHADGDRPRAVAHGKGGAALRTYRTACGITKTTMG